MYGVRCPLGIWWKYWAAAGSEEWKILANMIGRSGILITFTSVIVSGDLAPFLGWVTIPEKAWFFYCTSGRRNYLVHSFPAIIPSEYPWICFDRKSLKARSKMDVPFIPTFFSLPLPLLDVDDWRRDASRMMEINLSELVGSSPQTHVCVGVLESSHLFTTHTKHRLEYWI